MITCELIVKPENNFEQSLQMETNEHTFAEVEQATKLMIAELQRKLDNKENCPFYKNET